MKKRLLLLVLFCWFSFNLAFSQVGIGTNNPNPRAVLELKSPNSDQGFLVPRLTTAQRTATAFVSTLGTGEVGLLVFDTDTNKFYYWVGTAWVVIEDSVGTDNQTLSFSSPNLSISGGNMINLSAINTDAQNLTLGTKTGTQQPINISGGTGVTIDVADNDNSSTNEIQDLTLVTNTLSLSGDATTVNLAPYLDNTDAQNLTLGTKTGTQQPINISGGTGITIDVADNDNNTTNEIQDLSLTSNTLSLSGDGTTVNLAPYLDNTDNQDLSLSGTTLSLTGDGTSVNLSSINTDSQDLTLSSNILSLTNDATTVNLSGYLDNTDSQNLSNSVSGTQRTINISGGTGTTIDVADNDNSSTNEIQDLSLTSNTLSLSGDGTTVNLAPYLDNTDAQQLTFTPASSSLSISDGNSVTISGVGPGGSAGGDLTGTYPNPTLASSSGNSAVSAINNAATTGTINTGRLNTAVVLDTESPGGTSDISGNFNTGLQINTGAIATTDIANNAVTIAKINPSTINGQVLTTVSGATAWSTLPDASSSNEIQALSEVLTVSNDAKTLSAVNFSAISINTTATPGALNVNGSHYVSFTELPSGSETYDVKDSDYLIIGRSTVAKPYNVILPAASSNQGRILIIRSIGTSSSDGVSVSSSDGIDGVSQTSIMYASTEVSVVYTITIFCNGKTWYTIPKSMY